ncbi:MAG TPA: hypothetical protein VEH50_05815 [Methylomirabilota bacterium]|jgi:hypothetical protein|nr:hypothetical protein [Methylomirabilota bacterium]
MKKQGWFILSVLGLVICITSAPAHAQDGKISLFAGYSFGTNNFYSFDPTLHGYAADFAYNLNKHIGLEANFSGHNGTTTIYSFPATTDDNGYNDTLRQDIYAYTFGPRLSLPMGHFTLFTHFLVGGAHLHEGYTEKCTPATGEDEETCNYISGSTSIDYTSGSKGNGFAFKTGAGADWNHGFWGVRILEVDYVHAEVSTTENQTCTYACATPYKYTSSANNFELATGVTFNFGGAK